MEWTRETCVVAAMFATVGCVGEVPGVTSAELVQDGDDAPVCREGIESGHETICVESDPPPDCEMEIGAGWTNLYDSFGMFAGCACTGGFFCSGDSLPPGWTDEPGGGGGAPPPPPGRGPDETNACFDRCAMDADYRRSTCDFGGYDRGPNDPPCLYPSTRTPNHCAGAEELCVDRNVMPDGSSALPPGWEVLCAAPANGSIREACLSFYRECASAWLSHQRGTRTLAGDCDAARDRFETGCRTWCLASRGYEGMGCSSHFVDENGEPEGGETSGVMREELLHPGRDPVPELRHRRLRRVRLPRGPARAGLRPL